MPSARRNRTSATIELAPGILANVGLQILNAVNGKAEEEKKG